MEELSDLGKEIILLLVFEEAFDNIMAETKEPNKHAVKDELRSLIVKDFAKPAGEIETGLRQSFIYDSDRMFEYTYCLTAKGYQMMEILIQKKNHRFKNN